MSLKSFAKVVRMGALIGLAAAVSACGFDDVQLNGKIFDAMGVNTASTKKEVKLAERQPLIVPPQLQALPEPGAVVPPEATLAELKDHDESRKVSQEELQRQQEEFCRKNYDAGRALGDPTLDLIEGPLGTCRNSVFSAIKKINQSDE